MENIIIILILVLIVGAAGLYIYRSKKNGKKCIGCPESKTYPGNCSACKVCQERETE